MTIQVDTREHDKEWQRIKKQFDKHEVKYFRSKLYVGDYQSLDNPRLVIDRKKDLLEVCSNVCQQHERFRAELIRAIEAGIKLIILIEHGNGISSIEDVFFWHNPRLDETDIVIENGHPVEVQLHPKAVTGEQLFKCLLTIRDRYNVRFEFCDKRHTGQKIIELLGGDSNV